MRLIDKDERMEWAHKKGGEVAHYANVILHGANVVDAVPVVRCKDCKYFIQTVFFGNRMNVCRLHGSSTILPTARIVADNWFCAGGEKVSK